jgi:esterase
MRKVPKDGYLSANGIRLHYLDWGNVRYEPILLLHGFMAHAHAWDEFASCFRNRYHIIALDQRGHGESQWSKDGCYSIDAHFSDIAHIVRALDLRDLILMGHSMGGRNALFYTACCPQNVKRLILVDARPASGPRNSRALKHHLIHLPLQAVSMGDVAQAIRKLYPYMSMRTCRHLAYYGYKQTRRGQFVPKFDVRMSLESNRLGCVTEDLRPFLKNVSCPTLIVRGAKSLFLSRADARKICEIIPRATSQEIPVATHMPVQENPGAFQKVISEFLNERR